MDFNNDIVLNNPVPETFCVPNYEALLKNNQEPVQTVYGDIYRAKISNTAGALIDHYKAKYGIVPNLCYSSSDENKIRTKSIFLKKIKKYFNTKNITLYNVVNSSFGLTNENYAFEIENEKIIIFVHYFDYNILDLLYIVYENESPALKKIYKLFKKYSYTIKYKKTVNLIIQVPGGFTTRSCSMKFDETDIALNYGQNFKNVYETIFEKLTNNKKGIVLLHGQPGTGKTSFIKHLINKIEKEVLIIPPELAFNLSSPAFITFLLEHKNSILVIEDAEKIISSRENGDSSGVAAILNLSDGILGDCLQIQIIATFNTKKEMIDQALLRKGRLIAEHEFKKLSVEESNKLLKALNKEHVTNIPMSLTEIYNIDEQELKSIEEKRTIGFSTQKVA